MALEQFKRECGIPSTNSTKTYDISTIRLYFYSWPFIFEIHRLLLFYQIAFRKEVLLSSQPRFNEVHIKYSGAIPQCSKGNLSNFKIGCDRAVSVPGAFKLDHLQPLERILIKKIFNLLTFILGRPILIAPMANNWRREFIQLQNWM